MGSLSGADTGADSFHSFSTINLQMEKNPLKKILKPYSNLGGILESELAQIHL